MKTRIVTRKQILVYIVLTAVFMVAKDALVEPTYWLIVSRSSQWCSWLEFEKELNSWTELVKAKQAKKNEIAQLAERYRKRANNKVPRDLSDPVTQIFMRTFAEAMYPYRKNKRWSENVYYTRIVNVVRSRLLQPPLLKNAKRATLFFALVSLIMAVIDFIAYLVAMIRICKENRLSTSVRLYANAFISKDPLIFIPDYAKFQREKMRERILKVQRKDSLTQIDRLVNELSAGLSDLQSREPAFVQDINGRFKAASEKYEKTPNDMRLVQKMLRRFIREVDRKSHTPQKSSTPSATTSKVQPQRRNPRKRKNRPKKPKKIPTPRAHRHEATIKEEVPNWQIFFVTEPDGEPIPLTLTIESFREVLATHRRSVDAGNLLKRINRLLFDETPERRITYVPMRTFFPGFRKGRVGRRVRIFFTVDEENFTLTFSAFHRSHLDPLGADYN